MKFSKSERLCSRKSIEKLFSAGKTVFHYPFRVVWIETGPDNPFPAKTAIGVPGKKIRKAVNRNRIKRLIRESCRLNKRQLYEGLSERNRKIEMIIIYVADRELDFNYINERIPELFLKILNDEDGQGIF